MRYIRRTAATGLVYPQPTAYIFTERSQVHLSAGAGIPLCRHKQQPEAAQRLRNYTEVASVTEAQGYERPFCKDCLQRAAAKYHPK